MTGKSFQFLILIYYLLMKLIGYSKRQQVKLMNRVWISMLLCAGMTVIAVRSSAESIIRDTNRIGKKYSIHFSESYPQDVTIFDQRFRQAASEACGGSYIILEQCYTSSQMIGTIQCTEPNSKNSNSVVPLQPRIQQQQPSSKVESTLSSSQQQRERSPHFGAGIWSSFLNWGVGPSVEVYPLKYLGIMGTIGTLFDYTSFSGRGFILFPSLLTVAGFPNKPYLGAGFTYIKGSDVDFWGKTLQQTGSGVEVYGGILHSASYLLKNLYVRGEVIYSMVDMETTYKNETIYSGDLDTLDYKKFSFAIGLAYLF